MISLSLRLSFSFLLFLFLPLYSHNVRWHLRTKNVIRVDTMISGECDNSIVCTCATHGHRFLHNSNALHTLCVWRRYRTFNYFCRKSNVSGDMKTILRSTKFHCESALLLCAMVIFGRRQRLNLFTHMFVMKNIMLRCCASVGCCKCQMADTSNRGERFRTSSFACSIHVYMYMCSPMFGID